MPTCATPARSSREAICRSPAASWRTVNRSRASPWSPATQTAWSSLAQSTPAVTRAGAAFGSILMVVLSLLHQLEDTRWSRDTAAGRSLIGAHWRIALWPVWASWAAGPRGTHAGPRGSSERGDGPAGTRGAPEPSHSTSKRVTRLQGWCTSERSWLAGDRCLDRRRRVGGRLARRPRTAGSGADRGPPGARGG